MFQTNVAPENMTHFDKIAALTHQTFNTLIATIPENLAGRKVIAGLVMKRSDDDVGIVISIGTGQRAWFSSRFLIPFGKFGPPYLRTATAEQHYPVLQMDLFMFP